MSNKERHCAAWIRGFFISFALLLSSCSGKDNPATTQESTPSLPQASQASQASEDSKQRSKRPPFSQLILKKISIDYPYTPERRFISYINKLRARIDNKNMRTMQGELSPHFICLGPACTEGLPIAQQFESLVTGLGDEYWKSLLKIVKTKHYQQVNGHICGPARANYIGENQDQVVGKNWGYINGKNVRLRKHANTKASIVSHLSHNAVKLLSTQKSKKRGRQWLEVETLKGQRGFIVKKYFLMLNPQQICYQEIAGEWKISGFRSP
ncbi:MAG: hypothetical protein KAH03_00380 [Cocleimonas sp.]|nr:hypothetical protein [Cocleimonas sp.]